MLRLSIVIPVYNEVSGLSYLLPKLCKLPFVSDVVIADDNSNDGTKELVEGFYDKKVRLVENKNPRGLCSAVRYASQFCINNNILVMDGDGQHRSQDVQNLYNSFIELSSMGLDGEVIVGSRFYKTSKIVGMKPYRVLASKILNSQFRTITGNRTTDVMSGFFICNRELIQKTRGTGFKILKEILTTNSYVEVVDVPIVFEKRVGGKSKMSIKQLSELFK